MSITVDVHLISGKSVSLETEVDVCLDDLKQRAQHALGVGKGRLLTASGLALDDPVTVKKARLQDRDVLTLHVGHVRVAAPRMLTNGLRAFAAILGDGAVVTWGARSFVGDVNAGAIRCKMFSISSVLHSRLLRYALMVVL